MAKQFVMHALLCGALAWIASSAGTVRVVDAGGGGAFLDLQSAIDASADGDIVLVRSGNYASSTIDGKGVSVVADTRQSVHVAGSMHIVNVPSSSVALVQGLTVVGVNAPTNNWRAVEVLNSPGHVRIESSNLTGSIGSASTNRSGVYIENSAQTVLSGCTIRGGNATTFGGHSGVKILRPSVCALYDVDSRAGLTGEEGSGGHGLHLDSFSFAFTSNSLFEGRSGAPGPCPCGQGGNGGSGIRLDPLSEASVLDCVLLFGGGASSCPTFGCGSIGSGTGGAPTSGLGNVVSYEGAGRALAVSSPVREGATVTFTFHGRSGDDVALISSQEPAFDANHEWKGIRTAGREPMRLKHIGTIPADGSDLVVTQPVSSLPASAGGRLMFVQPLFTSPFSGESFLGTPCTVVVLDSAL